MKQLFVNRPMMTLKLIVAGQKMNQMLSHQVAMRVVVVVVAVEGAASRQEDNNDDGDGGDDHDGDGGGGGDHLVFNPR